MIHLLFDTLGKIVGINVTEPAECRIAMCIQGILIIVQLSIDYRKVQLENQLRVPFLRRMLTDVQFAIQLIELVLGQHIVVMFQHGQGQALPEPARTDEEEKHVGLFYRGDKTGLVHEIAIVLADIHKVHHALRNAFTVLAHNLLLFQ